MVKNRTTDYLSEQIYGEYSTAKANQDAEMGDFEANLDCLDGKRTEKDYEWMSDVSTHDYASIVLTEASSWANQMFQSRDFVDPILEGDKPEDMKKCSAAKKIINKTLNNREIYHYQKYLRARTINATASCVHALCYWDKDVQTIDHGEREVPYPVYFDDNGQPSKEPTPDVRMVNKKVAVKAKIIHKDYFNYQVLDPRNVFYDNSYCYSIQEKEWIIIRSEESLENLEANKEKNGYFNLDKIEEEFKIPSETETSRETYNKLDQQQQQPKPVSKMYDKLIRFGKIWAVVNEREDDGYPIKISDGYDELGNRKDKAELVEAVIEMVISGSSKTIIRFQPQPFRTKSGRPYRNIIRGLCYIHPVKDVGINDGKYLRQLQVATDDTVNMSNDRVQLATIPTFIGKPYLEDQDSFRIEPEHMNYAQDPENDVKELKIRDNVSGAMQQVALFISKMQQLSAVYPTTMGGMPDKASTTATAVAGGESRGNLRSNYKSLTFEYTFNLDFYWMLLQMFYQFAEKETALDVMGEDSELFDPDPLFTYQPVSSNIEMEANKVKKIQNWDQLIGRLSGLAKILPEAIPVIAHAIGRIAELQGDEYRMIAPIIDKLAKAKPQQEEAQGQQPKNMQDQPVSNQNDQPMSTQEQAVRPGM